MRIKVQFELASQSATIIDYPLMLWTNIYYSWSLSIFNRHELPLV